METETVLNGLDNVIKLSTKFGIRFLIDLLFVILILKVIYLKVYKNKELVFTYFVFNIIIFSVSFSLNKIELSLGAAFGLFAVFGMLRYKTEEISINNMTYLFLFIAIGLICAVTKIKGTDDAFEYLFLILLNALVFLIVYILENNVFFKREQTRIITYEKIELINASNHSELINELKTRTGLNIQRIEIQKIDFLRDSAQIKVFYID
jgi:hypothetical protein